MDSLNVKTPGRYVILFQGRTGSSFLTEALNAHPGIHAEGEGFAPNKESRVARVKPRFEEFMLESDDRIRGCKMKVEKIVDFEGYGEVMRRAQARIIILDRRNRIKHAVSHFRAVALYDRTGDWNLYSPQDKIPAIHIDPDEFEEKLRFNEARRRHLFAYAATLGLPVLVVYYEELLCDFDGTIGLLLDFLGAERVPLRGLARKNTSDDLRQAVANYDELRERLAGTPYEPMFEPNWGRVPSPIPWAHFERPPIPEMA